jgi:hypothetical protein
LVFLIICELLSVGPGEGFLKVRIASKRVPFPTCSQIGKGDAVIGIVDSKRSCEQTLNFRNGSADFCEGFAFVLFVLYYPTRIVALIRDCLSLRSKGESAEGQRRCYLDMIDERIEKTKAAIESAENIPADRKAELLDLLSKLKPAIAKVSETHHEDARSIARLVEASAHETIRAEKKPEHTNRLLRELKRSVENFETSHPELTAFVTKYSAVLSALGI